jgi:hypothetical protein
MNEASPPSINPEGGSTGGDKSLHKYGFAVLYDFIFSWTRGS